jgi:predicted nuclease of predicted toxin-antitoxin system
MWLLDANMPVQLVALLKNLTVDAETAAGRGWNTLSNGRLISAAAEAKFKVLLTRDRIFGQAASVTLRAHPEFCVVRVTLPQLRAAAFVQAFRAAWQESPISPEPGRMIEWPSSQN